MTSLYRIVQGVACCLMFSTITGCLHVGKYADSPGFPELTQSQEANARQEATSRADRLVQSEAHMFILDAHWVDDGLIVNAAHISRRGPDGFVCAPLDGRELRRLDFEPGALDEFLLLDGPGGPVGSLPPPKNRLVAGFRFSDGDRWPNVLLTSDPDIGLAIVRMRSSFQRPSRDATYRVRLNRDGLDRTSREIGCSIDADTTAVVVEDQVK